MITRMQSDIAKGKLATMDFETKSECDLRKHGAWVYAKHPSTEALCLSYKLPGQPVKTWHMAHGAAKPWNQDAPSKPIPESAPPDDLFAWIKAGGLIEAHNAFFERCIWTHVMVVKYDWPELDPDKLRCSASKASASALPRNLEGAAKSMNLPVEKDMDGRALMLKMTKPRKPRKDERQAWIAYQNGTLEWDEVKEKWTWPKDTPDKLPAGMKPHPVVWFETEEAIYRNHQYCERDVETEEAFSAACPDLDPRELQLWQLDQNINWHGVRVDLNLAKASLKRSAEAKQLLAEEMCAITGIDKPSQRAKVKEWLGANGTEIEDTRSGTIDWYLENHTFINEDHRRVLEIIKSYNRTSIRKYQAIIDKTDPVDCRARDILMYHGASTGRWSGRGIQVQNFPRGHSKNDHYWDKKRQKFVEFFNMDKAVRDIKDMDIDTALLAMLYGDIMELLSSSLRGAIQPSDDDLIMMVADYSAIEARCVLWAAGAEAALEVFRRGGDIYCDMAEGIYGYAVNKKDHPEERQFGKQAILGLGYGMGYLTFLLTCRMYNIKFGVDQVKKIVGKELYPKYVGWVKRSLLNPVRRENEDMKDFKKRVRAATQKKNKLIEARIDPHESLHELVLMKYTVEVYRKRYPEVPALWKAQEAAAIAAVRAGEEHYKFELDMAGISPFDDGADEIKNNLVGPRINAGKFNWFVKGGFLCCELPSGRLLRYRDAYIKDVETEWGEKKPAIRYYTVVLGSKWGRTATYGGKIVENEIQAIARDIMADAMLEMEDTPYKPLMTVHDEIVAECQKELANKKEFEQLMCNIGPWADGCPITAEADTMVRYRK